MKTLGPYILCIFIFFNLLTDARGDSPKIEIDIKRENDKTIYIIGESQTDKEKDQRDVDRKEAWDMLKHMNIRIDKR